MFIKYIFSIVIFFAAIINGGQNIKILWNGQQGEAELPPKIVVTKAPTGVDAFQAEAISTGNWQGMSGLFDHPVDLKQYSGISFQFRHTISAYNKLDAVIRLEYVKNSGKTPYIYRNFLSGPRGEWKEIFVPFEPQSWNATEKTSKASFETAVGLTIYPFRALNTPGQSIEVSGVSFVPQTQMEKSDKLPIMNYEYINPPTAGDPNAVILTDGKISKDSQAFFREYSNDFTAIFDLGAIYTLNRVELAALAPGSHNFSEMTVFAGISRDNLFPIGNIKNQLMGSEEELCTWQLNKNFVARYMKLVASKLRPDFPIYLSEVTVFGKLPTQEELHQQAFSSYDTGPDLDPRSDEHCHHLSSGNIECWIDRKTGMLNGILSDNKTLIERLYHTMMTMTRAKDTRIDPLQDRVIDSKILPDRATLTITNSELPGIQLIKEYRLTPSELYEKVTVEAAPDVEPYFLRLETNVILNKDFRRDGVYESWGDGHYMSREFAQDVMIDKNVCNMPTMIFENHKKDLTLLHHIYRYNDRFILLNSASEEDHRTAFCPNGYRLALASIVPSHAHQHSIESRLALTPGTLLEAYDKYRALPEVRLFYDTIQRPRWLRDLKLQSAAGWQGACIDGAERAMENYNRLLLPNGFITGDIGSNINSVWGEFPISGNVFDNAGGFQSAEEVRQRGRNLKKICSFLKNSTYTWGWSAYENAAVLQQHPEWFVRFRRNGAKASWFPGSYRVNYLRFFGIPESRNEIRDAILRMFQFYELDFWYLDGGNCGSYARDFARMIQDDPHGQMDFYRDMRREIQKKNPEGIVFFNTPGNPVGDIGYLESFTGGMTSSWRTGAAWMWKFKMFQYQDPLRYPCYIYWLSGIEGPYQNYLLGTGLLPAYNSRAFSARDIPFLSARFEMRQLELAEADVTPNWRNDPHTNLECITQRQGNAGFVFMQQHGAEKAEKVSVSPAGLGLDNPNKPLWMWFFRFRNGKEFKGSFGERDIAAQYGKNHWRAERAVQCNFLGEIPWEKRLTQEFMLHQNEGGFWMLSEVPAVIWSVNGLPTHFRLPSLPGISIHGNQQTLTVETEFANLEIGVILPDHFTVENLQLNGKKTPCRVVMEPNCRLAVFHIQECGKHQIEMQLVKATSPAVLPIPELKLKGTTLSLHSSEPMLYGIFKDDTCVWSNTGEHFQLDLSGAVENGNYELRTMTPDRAAGPSQSFTLKNVAKPTRVDRLVDHLQVLDRVDQRKIKGANGIEISESRSAWSDGAADPDETFADPEKMLLQCATLPQQRSGWNYAAAGFEIQAKRFMKIELLNGMKEIRGLNPGRHSVKYDDPQCLIGLILDFATPEGYKTRSVASFGLQNEKRSGVDPRWGCNSKPDYIMILNNIVNEHKVERESIWLDLQQLGCPTDWNGKLYFNLVFGNVAPFRKFAVRILECSEQIPEKVEVIKPLVISGKVQQEIRPATRINEKPDWSKIPVFASMHSSVPGRKVTMPTQVKVAYDSNNFYLHYSMKIYPSLALTPGSTGKPWQGDGVEFFLQNPVKMDRILHFIVDCSGNFLATDADWLKRPGMTEAILPTSPVEVDSQVLADTWLMTLTLPWSFFQAEGKIKDRSITFNAMRNIKNKDGNQEFFLLAPGIKYFSGEALKISFP